MSYLAPIEIAHILNRKRSTILAYLKSGALEGIKIRGQWRVHPDKLKEFIKNGGK